MNLSRIAPSVNLEDFRDMLPSVRLGNLPDTLVIIPHADYQQALFYAGMKGAFSVACLAFLILGFAVLVRECARFNSIERARS